VLKDIWDQLYNYAHLDLLAFFQSILVNECEILSYNCIFFRLSNITTLIALSLKPVRKPWRRRIHIVGGVFIKTGTCISVDSISIV
jgi:hypothetical protein